MFVSHFLNPTHTDLWLKKKYSIPLLLVLIGKVYSQTSIIFNLTLLWTLFSLRVKWVQHCCNIQNTKWFHDGSIYEWCKPIYCNAYHVLWHGRWKGAMHTSSQSLDVLLALSFRHHVAPSVAQQNGMYAFCSIPTHTHTSNLYKYCTRNIYI